MSLMSNRRQAREGAIGKSFNENDFVKAKIRRLENGNISLGLKLSDFEDDEGENMAEAGDSTTKEALTSHDVELPSIDEPSTL